MLVINSLEEGVEVFKALGSDLRANIIKLLLKNEEMNMRELASALHITNGAITSHIKKLEEAGIVEVMTECGGKGNQKICRIKVEQILVSMDEQEKKELRVYETQIKVGDFCAYDVLPTCGLASTDKIIGTFDTPSAFEEAGHTQAGILWFSQGYVEYDMTSLLSEHQRIAQLTLCFEISSEAPGYQNDWLSDISFKINGKYLGKWTSPGDFGGKNGIYTPSWWSRSVNQYGLLKMLVINRSGCFLDGLKLSDLSMDELQLEKSGDIRFRFEVDKNAEHVGGLTLFGHGFGNYNQDIMVRAHYVVEV